MFFPHSEEETRIILSELGVPSLEHLFSHISSTLLSKPEHLPEPKSEEELRRFFFETSLLNKNIVSFAGAGSYDRVIPSAIKYLISRGELLTAYTPYQAEASQGTLQAIFEYQSVVCELTGMEVANASMYDGASALAEAVLMARSIKDGFCRVIVSSTINPLYIKVVETYLKGFRDEVIKVGWTDEGTVDLQRVEEELRKGGVYGLAVQYPNFFGYVEKLKDLGSLALEYDVPFIVVSDPVALSILKPPGDFGADIVVGEGQQLGIPMNFGGPYVGFFATREKYVRKMPGRLVGMAEDADGNRAFTLVLQTREQHIRREKATSNICTNQNLLAVANLIYISLLGPEGLKTVACHSLSKASYIKEVLIGLGFEEVFHGKHLWEFPLRINGAEDIWYKLLEKGYMLGVPLGRMLGSMEDSLLIAVTEKRTKTDMDEMADLLGEII